MKESKEQLITDELEVKESPKFKVPVFQIVFVLMALYIFYVVCAKVYDILNVYNSHYKSEEVKFATEHPEIVKPIRELYIRSHKETDNKLKDALTL